MASTTWGEKPVQEERYHHRRKKTPSFSSSLLDAICHSIDESHHNKEGKFQDPKLPLGPIYRGGKHNASVFEEDISSHRRAIMVDKWMENYTRDARNHRHFNSDSSSSVGSSLFSSSETESAASRSTPKSSNFHIPKTHSSMPQRSKRDMLYEIETTTKHEGKLFMRTKTRALKIYGDLKKVKQPISPGGKITNFLNSFLFNSRNMKKNQGIEELNVQGLKSRSLKESQSNSSRSCLNTKPAHLSENKSKRSVRFCPVSVILDEDCQPCGHKNIYDDHDDYDSSLRSMPSISSQYIKKNIDSFREHGMKRSYDYHHQIRGFYEQDVDYDDRASCTSSDLFELDNIGIVGLGSSREELPVYGTTNLKLHHAISTGMVV